MTTPADSGRTPRNTVTTISASNTYPAGDEVDPRVRMHDTGQSDAATFGAALRGTYREAWSKNVSRNLSRAIAAADNAASELARLDDPTTPQPMDPALAKRQIHETASTEAEDALRAADAAMTQIVEAARKEALPPAPGGTSEQLARDQILTHLGEPQNDLEALTRLEELTASTNPAVVATVAGEYGRALARRFGIAPEDFEARVIQGAIEAAAVGRLGAKYKHPAEIVTSWRRAAAAYAGVSGGVRGRFRSLTNRPGF